MKNGVPQGPVFLLAFVEGNPCNRPALMSRPARIGGGAGHARFEGQALGDCRLAIKTIIILCILRGNSSGENHTALWELAVY
ncbi:MAG: hypothetical protein ACI82H_000761 [Alphaproteobacteria bacterium]|jgi:hypothetical protein